jgi:hypothetical protein
MPTRALKNGVDRIVMLEVLFPGKIVVGKVRRWHEIYLREVLGMNNYSILVSKCRCIVVTLHARLSCGARLAGKLINHALHMEKCLSLASLETRK